MITCLHSDTCIEQAGSTCMSMAFVPDLTGHCMDKKGRGARQCYYQKVASLTPSSTPSGCSGKRIVRYPHDLAPAIVHPSQIPQEHKRVLPEGSVESLKDCSEWP